MAKLARLGGAVAAVPLLLLTAGAGCMGKIGNSRAGTGSGAGTGTGAGSGAGLGGTTGATGLAGTGSVVTTPPANAGVVVVRRLNHDEYNNSVRDLLGTSLTPAVGFPADDLGAEFDTVGSALSLSPGYAMAYEAAATALVNDLFANATRKAKVVTCNVDTGGDACAQTVLGTFARRAWRRPVTTEEVQGLMLPMTTAKTQGLTPTDGIKAALAAVLLSPYFVFKVEIDPNPTSAQSRRLTAHELATRLSYGLWSTTPDDALAAAADGGQLTTDDQVATQIDRMLTDSRADTLLDAFAGEWLDYRTIDGHDVDPKLFPKYTPALMASMRLEARRFMQEFLRTDTPVQQMLSARFTFVDSTLATHYGVTRTGGAATDFVRVDTSSTDRSGLLTLGAFLTSTSLPNRTSPVKRGNFIFTRLLCGFISQPPPDVPPLPEQDTTGLSLRERLEAHRSKPECMPCHAIMDPLGFGLEHYDALGAYRATDGTATIDATGTLPDGKTTFDGAVQLAAALSGDSGFSGCLTNKFMTFAIGRLLTQRDDRAWISYLSNRALAAGGSLKTIIRTVMLSDAFRSRQAVPPS